MTYAWMHRCTRWTDYQMQRCKDARRQRCTLHRCINAPMRDDMLHIVVVTIIVALTCNVSTHAESHGKNGTHSTNASSAGSHVLGFIWLPGGGRLAFTRTMRVAVH